MNNKIDISEGYSKVYLVPAIFIFAISIPFLIFVWYVGVILILLGVLLLYFKSGVLIDPYGIRFMAYKSIFGLKLGTWSTLKPYTFVWIKFSRDVDQDYIASPMEAGSMFQAVTFDVYVKNENAMRHVYEFTSYKFARLTLEAMVECFEMEYDDPIEKAKSKVKKRYDEFNS